jgi:hypothetical protein
MLKVQDLANLLKAPAGDKQTVGTLTGCNSLSCLPRGTHRRKELGMKERGEKKILREGNGGMGRQEDVERRRKKRKGREKEE